MNKILVRAAPIPGAVVGAAVGALETGGGVAAVEVVTTAVVEDAAVGMVGDVLISRGAVSAATQWARTKSYDLGFALAEALSEYPVAGGAVAAGTKYAAGNAAAKGMAKGPAGRSAVTACKKKAFLARRNAEEVFKSKLRDAKKAAELKTGAAKQAAQRYADKLSADWGRYEVSMQKYKHQLGAHQANPRIHKAPGPPPPVPG